MNTSSPASASPTPAPGISDNPLIPLGVALDPATRAKHDELWAKLTAPFPESDVDWLLKDDDVVRRADVLAGRVFAYVNARAVQQRLDDIFGMYWSTKMTATSFMGTRGGVICELSVYVPALGWLTKTDVCDLSQIEPVRGGASGALKRVAVQFGIGRYLYGLPETWVQLGDKGEYRIRYETRTMLWERPLLPSWALPEKDRAARDAQFKEIEQRRADEVKRLADEKAQREAAAAAAKAEQASQSASAAKASASASEANASESSPSNVEPMSPASPFVVALRKVMGNDDRLSIAYLKYKKFMPSGANSMEQLPRAYADKVLQNAKTVSERMRRLSALAEVIGRRDGPAKLYFLAEGLIKPADTHWFALSDAAIERLLTPAQSEKLARALDRFCANAAEAAA